MSTVKPILSLMRRHIVSEVLLYKLSGRPTGRQIARQLGLSFGTPFYLRKNPPRRIAVRWGGAEWPEYEDARTINKSAAIRLASSKLSSFRRMAEAGVPVPRFTASRNEAGAWGNDVVVFGRTSQGFQGRGIRVYEPGAHIGQHELFTEYIPNEREYRLHVCGGVVISVQRKYLERPGLNGQGYIKNHDHGYVFKTPEKDLNTSRKEAAVAAVEALGLDFGAVDMVVGEDNKEYVLEVNTAPALSPLRIRAYADALKKVLNGPHRAG